MIKNSFVGSLCFFDENPIWVFVYDRFTTKHSKTMPVSRFIFFSSKRRSTEAFNLLRRSVTLKPFNRITCLHSAVAIFCPLFL